MAIEDVIQKGNFYQKDIKENKSNHVPLYLGSGDFGGCFDEYGLMNRPFLSRVSQNTVLMHADFWHRGNFGLDYHIPALQIMYDKFQEDKVSSIEQSLNIYDGVLSTTLTYGKSEMTLNSFFNPYLRDVFATEIIYEIDSMDDFPDIIVKNVPIIQADYGTELESDFVLEIQNQNCFEYKLTAGTALASVMMSVINETGEAVGIANNNEYKLRLYPGTGRLLLLVGMCNPNRKENLSNQIRGIHKIAEYKDLTKINWHKRWGDSVIDFEYPFLHELFLRSIYYMLCSFSPADNCIAPPTGWTGSAWSYHFPQDFSLITPVLLKMGHVDIVKAKIEFYARQIPVMKEYTQRIFKTKGTMWAWEFPIGDNANILPEEYPNWYQFEIHNAAYPAKMAYEVAMYIEDDKWKREIAWEIIYQSAQFYSSILQKEGTTWGIHTYPSMGQDELGGENSKNYLCALYAARYTLTIALKMAEINHIDFLERKQWEVILREGLAFDKLINKKLRIYQNYEIDENLYEIGKMKHPVPLMPITFLPQDNLDEQEKNAFEMRYRLCDRANEHFYHGWTLCDFMLADAKMADKDGFIKDFNDMIPSNYVDKDYLQIYESSTLLPCIYYITSHGLFAQAIIEGAVNANVLGFHKLSYKNIHVNNKTVNTENFEDL